MTERLAKAQLLNSLHVAGTPLIVTNVDFEKGYAPDAAGVQRNVERLISTRRTPPGGRQVALPFSGGRSVSPGSTR